MLRDSLFAETRCKDTQCTSKQWSVEILLNSTDHFLTFNACDAIMPPLLLPETLQFQGLPQFLR